MSVGGTAGSSGGGVGSSLVDMVKVETLRGCKSKSRGKDACDWLIEAPYHLHQSVSPRLLATMEGFDEEIESILYMCREVSGELYARTPLR